MAKIQYKHHTDAIPESSTNAYCTRLLLQNTAENRKCSDIYAGSSHSWNVQWLYQITVRFWNIEMLVKVEVLLSAWKQSAYVIVPAPKKCQEKTFNLALHHQKSTGSTDVTTVNGTLHSDCKRCYFVKWFWPHYTPDTHHPLSSGCCHLLYAVLDLTQTYTTQAFRLHSRQDVHY